MARLGLDSTKWVTVFCIALALATALLVLFDRPTRELFMGRPDRGASGAKWYKTTDPVWWEPPHNLQELRETR